MCKGTMLVYLLCASVALSGCSSIRAYTMPPHADLLSGAGSLHTTKGSTKKFEEIDVDELIAEYGLQPAARISDADLASASNRYVYLRNNLQDRIVAASNQRCGYYLRQIVSAKAQSQMGWGTLSLLLSGAASVTTPIRSAQILAAGGAAATGVNTLYGEAYFNSLTVSVISAGITKEREAILDRVKEPRKQSLINYPINKAVADAIAYHAACNILTGLETAAGALQRSPGDSVGGAVGAGNPNPGP